jgi:hypothetical protein
MSPTIYLRYLSCNCFSKRHLVIPISFSLFSISIKLNYWNDTEKEFRNTQEKCFLTLGMSNKIITIGVTEWMGHSWFAMLMINPPLWLMAQLGVPRFPQLWYSRFVMSQPRFELGLCLHSFDRAWFASHGTTLGSLVFTPAFPLMCDWLTSHASFHGHSTAPLSYMTTIVPMVKGSWWSWVCVWHHIQIFLGYYRV